MFVYVSGGDNPLMYSVCVIMHMCMNCKEIEIMHMFVHDIINAMLWLLMYYCSSTIFLEDNWLWKSQVCHGQWYQVSLCYEW